MVLRDGSPEAVAARDAAASSTRAFATAGGSCCARRTTSHQARPARTWRPCTRPRRGWEWHTDEPDRLVRIPERRGEPDFENLLRVLRREKPARPTLFEFFLNDRLHERLAPAASPAQVPLTPSQVSPGLRAFHRAGYDFTNVLLPGFEFPTGRDFTAAHRFALRGWADPRLGIPSRPIPGPTPRAPRTTCSTNWPRRCPAA